VKDLVVRLSALDADAGAAVQVIGYFDSLVESRAGLTAVVRGAAVLAGCPARFVDEARRLYVRVDADGVSHPDGGRADPGWPSVALTRDGAEFWLERSGVPGPVDAMIVERAAAALTTVLDRTRARPSVVVADDALVEVLLDASADEADRRRAARRLGLVDGSRLRAVARADGSRLVAGPADRLPDRGRVGVGPSVAPLGLPSSYAAARLALRFAADGTEADPGPRIVDAETLGGLTVLAEAVGPDTTPVADVVTLGAAAATHPWLLATLDAIARSGSLRTAATLLNVHHSSLQDRVAIAERLLGWSLHDPSGRLRTELALVLRRLHANP
jgi:hypothetical protein